VCGKNVGHAGVCVPVRDGDWRCECGDLNRDHEAFCYRCGAGRLDPEGDESSHYEPSPEAVEHVEKGLRAARTFSPTEWNTRHMARTILSGLPGVVSVKEQWYLARLQDMKELDEHRERAERAEADKATLMRELADLRKALDETREQLVEAERKNINDGEKA
jgi:hypothetical protein